MASPARGRYTPPNTGLIKSPGAQVLDGRVTFQRLSWSDHDLLH